MSRNRRRVERQRNPSWGPICAARLMGFAIAQPFLRVRAMKTPHLCVNPVPGSSRMLEHVPMTFIHTSAVTRGIALRVHLLRRWMDCRVEPGNDAGGTSAGQALKALGAGADRCEKSVLRIAAPPSAKSMSRHPVFALTAESHMQDLQNERARAGRA